MNNDRQEIEELIKEFVNLNPISDEANNFAKNKLTGTITLRHKEIKSAHIGFLIFQNKKNEVNFSYKVIKSLIKYMNSKKIFTHYFAGTSKKNLSSNFLLTALGFKLKKRRVKNFEFELKL